MLTSAQREEMHLRLHLAMSERARPLAAVPDDRPPHDLPYRAARSTHPRRRARRQHAGRTAP
ncbi:hypothetical protein C5C55_12310 [Rathayibacter sp. AY1C2]|nr:hypothetical protein C5C55_12310 [Rathayibacter sp. AY1C2]